ncbi:hypothetical protein [Ralstonia pseudosolanacearum]|uniref:hypothetical protein n=1 Tax=Ralstonia pseudosolanacearum TaxID=1310165 RepID=UPI001FF82943|nr:hypothetical protein [Ralstonia pseudosolanacearum]
MATVTAAWGTVRAHLEHARFSDIKTIVGLAGLDLMELGRVRQEEGASKGQLMTAIDAQLRKLDETEQKHSVAIVLDELLKRNPGLGEPLADDLARHGWGLADNRLVPLELFDLVELATLPDVPRQDLVKAAERFRNGDLGGAISAACGAVDSAVADVYALYQLGERKHPANPS